jgi:hypothetical protein
VRNARTNEQGDRYGRHFSEDIARIRTLPPADRRAVDNRRGEPVPTVKPAQRAASRKP